VKRSASALLALFIALLISPFAPAYAQESVPSFVLTSWNIQSSQSDPGTIAEQMALFDGVDIWVLQEVNAKETGYYRAGAEDGEDASFGMVMSSAGDGNHLLTLYDLSRFILMGSSELAQVNTTGNARPAQVLHLMDIDTEAEFLVVNNHLYSSRANERIIQAVLLNDWTNEQTLPSITAGDFNFEPKATDLGFVNMTVGDAWSWIEPEQLLASLPSGKLVDHVFTAGAAQDWPVSTQVVVREGDTDSNVNADHKPLIVLVGPEVAAPLIPCGTTSAESCFSQEPREATTTVTGVTKSGLNVRSLPSTSGAVLRTLPAGASIIIASTSEDGLWYALDGGGWVSAAYVTKQSAAPQQGTRSGATVVVVPTTVPAQPTAVSVQPTAVPTLLPERSVTVGALVIIKVDKGAEYVVIRNDSGAAVDLSGWTLLSEKGSQACPLGGVIEPGAILTISALGDVAGFNCGFGGPIWNNRERDPAALIAPDGAVTSRFE
jgi:endonuclease/exonuclease/phosphatase family metal-dependent hydrolase/uncharacterized protein YraI